MAELARWTTPTITYKPSAVSMADVAEIYLVIMQSDEVIITRDMATAGQTEEGFSWSLTQEETSTLRANRTAEIQVDYKTTAEVRYTTTPKRFEISDSGMQEVI